MKLILHDLAPLHFAVAGGAIGAVTLLLLALGNQRLGVSGGFENLCALVMRRTPYFARDEVARSHGWRLPFLAGLLAGGVLSAVAAGSWSPTWALGMFDARFGWGPAGKAAWMLAGGALIGFGTRLANGCTSGHGIFGVANFEKSGWLAMASFMAAGFVTTNLVFRALGGG